MTGALDEAVNIALKWAVPAAITTAGTWMAVKHKAIRDRWRRRQARRSAIDSFIEQQMPELVRFVAGSKEREDRAALRETRITTELQGFREHLSRQDIMLESIAAQLWAAARFDVQARFQCDHDGRNISVNQSYAKLMRVSEFDLGDYRWKTYLDEHDAGRYIAAVKRCFEEHRRFEGPAIFKRGDGTRFRAHVRIEPHPEDRDDLGAHKLPTWFGSVLLIEELEQ